MQARETETVQPVHWRAGKHATIAKGGKTCNRCQGRELNLQPVPSARKLATDAKGGKTCNRCQGPENLQPMPRAGKHATVAKGGKRATTLWFPCLFLTIGKNSLRVPFELSVLQSDNQNKLSFDSQLKSSGVINLRFVCFPAAFFRWVCTMQSCSPI